MGVGWGDGSGEGVAVWKVFGELLIGVLCVVVLGGVGCVSVCRGDGGGMFFARVGYLRGLTRLACFAWLPSCAVLLMWHLGQIALRLSRLWLFPGVTWSTWVAVLPQM